MLLVFLKRNIFRLIIIGSVFSLNLSLPAFASLPGEIHTQHDYHFSVPPGLQNRVKFWESIYSEFSTQQVLVHDIDNPQIIYEVVYIGKSKLSRKQRERKIGGVKRKYQKILRKLAKAGKDRSKLSPEERRVADLVKKNFRKA